MLFEGSRPLTVLHRKLDGKWKCSCGAPLEPLDGEWIHPAVGEPRPEMKDSCPFLDACAKAIPGQELVCVDGCVFHRFGVLIHSAALDTAKDQMMRWGMPEETAEQTVAPLRMEVP